MQPETQSRKPSGAESQEQSEGSQAQPETCLPAEAKRRRETRNPSTHLNHPVPVKMVFLLKLLDDYTRAKILLQ